MGIPLIIAVFVTVWGIAVFFVLPFGNAPSSQPQPGEALSAPENPRLKQKFLITTVLALIITAFAVWLSASGLINFRE